MLKKIRFFPVQFCYILIVIAIMLLNISTLEAATGKNIKKKIYIKNTDWFEDATDIHLVVKIGKATDDVWKKGKCTMISRQEDGVTVKTGLWGADKTPSPKTMQHSVFLTFDLKMPTGGQDVDDGATFEIELPKATCCEIIPYPSSYWTKNGEHLEDIDGNDCRELSMKTCWAPFPPGDRSVAVCRVPNCLDLVSYTLSPFIVKPDSDWIYLPEHYGTIEPGDTAYVDFEATGVEAGDSLIIFWDEINQYTGDTTNIDLRTVYEEVYIDITDTLYWVVGEPDSSTIVYIGGNDITVTCPEIPGFYLADTTFDWILAPFEYPDAYSNYDWFALNFIRTSPDRVDTSSCEVRRGDFRTTASWTVGDGHFITNDTTIVFPITLTRAVPDEDWAYVEFKNDILTYEPMFHKQVEGTIWADSFVVDFPEDELELIDSLFIITTMRFAPSSYDTLIAWIEYIPLLSLSLPMDAEGCPGSSVSIPLTLNNPDEIEIEGINITITFDETVLDATGATLEGGVLEDWDYGFFANTEVDGEIRLVFYAQGDLYTGDGIIAYLEFDVVGEEGTSSDLAFTFGEVNETPAALDDGYFTVVPCTFDISGFIGYYDGLAPVPNVDVNITGDLLFYTATTDEFGEYLFPDIPGGFFESTSEPYTGPIVLSGLDASRIARFSVGLYSFNCMQWIASDVSLNGFTSGMDASRVARYSVGLIDAMNPEDIEWVFPVELILDCPDWEPIVYENTYYYAPLESDLIDQDFFGIILGDVSGNWPPDSREILSSEAFEAIEIETNINSTLKIPIVIEEARQIEGIDICISFNPEVLQLTGLILDEGILDKKDYATETNLKDGKMVIYALKNLIAEKGTVVFIEFDIIGAVGSKTDVYFTKFDVNETEASGGFKVIDSESNEIITRRLEVNVVQSLPDKFALYSNYPNPFSSNTLIRYDLPKDTHVTIQIYNVRGQLVKELVNGVESAGRKQIEWNSKAMSSGIYFYKLSTKDKTFIKKMIIIKR